jgi:hypothetical protein
MIILDPVQLGGGVGMGMREGDERLAAFDAAITSMKEDGTLNALILEWFGEDAAPGGRPGGGPASCAPPPFIFPIIRKKDATPRCSSSAPTPTRSTRSAGSAAT